MRWQDVFGDIPEDMMDADLLADLRAQAQATRELAQQGLLMQEEQQQEDRPAQVFFRGYVAEPVAASPAIRRREAPRGLRMDVPEVEKQIQAASCVLDSEFTQAPVSRNFAGAVDELGGFDGFSYNPDARMPPPPQGASFGMASRAPKDSILRRGKQKKSSGMRKEASSPSQSDEDSDEDEVALAEYSLGDFECEASDYAGNVPVSRLGAIEKRESLGTLESLLLDQKVIFSFF